ncbi:hypothetical protein PSHT_15187 [Puccinia striiformis]|uniref:C2H2-type domain-containing protein n=1 Tax=Puccinia striiformis TaxID=27350 RepID=A0A2S4UGU0_9BASI|nr:hypothetical protein PSHT_15187 [Puccinia striiformis]
MAEPEQTHECQISRAQTDDYQDYHYPIMSLISTTHHHPAEGNLLDFDLDATITYSLRTCPQPPSNFTILHSIIQTSVHRYSTQFLTPLPHSCSHPRPIPLLLLLLLPLFHHHLAHQPNSLLLIPVLPSLPLDLVPNNPILPEPAHHNLAHDIDYQQIQLNQLDDLSEFSFDTHLHDWNLSFDTASSENLQGSYDSAIRSSENDPYRVISQMNLPEEQGTFSTDEYLKDFYRPTAEGEEPQTPILAMKRRRSSSPGQADQEEAPLGISDALCSLAHMIVIPQSQPINLSSLKKPSRSDYLNLCSICPECGKSFPRLTSLTQHKITHNGERPFRCGFEGCTKSFTTSSNTKRHWKTHF